MSFYRSKTNWKLHNWSAFHTSFMPNFYVKKSESNSAINKNIVKKKNQADLYFICQF